MSVPPARREKPSSAEEIARVMRVYDLIEDELHRRNVQDPRADGNWRGLLEVADRIAARTQDR